MICQKKNGDSNLDKVTKIRHRLTVFTRKISFKHTFLSIFSDLSAKKQPNLGETVAGRSRGHFLDYGPVFHRMSLKCGDRSSLAEFTV